MEKFIGMDWTYYFYMYILVNNISIIIEVIIILFEEVLSIDDDLSVFIL